MERSLNELEIDLIIHAVHRKSKFVGSGTLIGTYKFLYETGIVKPLLLKNSNNFYDFILTDDGFDYATLLLKAINL